MTLWKLLNDSALAPWIANQVLVHVHWAITHIDSSDFRHTCQKKCSLHQGVSQSRIHRTPWAGWCCPGSGLLQHQKITTVLVSNDQCTCLKIGWPVPRCLLVLVLTILGVPVIVWVCGLPKHVSNQSMLLSNYSYKCWQWLKQNSKHDNNIYWISFATVTSTYKTDLCSNKVIVPVYQNSCYLVNPESSHRRYTLVGTSKE